MKHFICLLFLTLSVVCPRVVYALDEHGVEDGFYGYAKPYIPPGMARAIEENEARRASHIPTGETVENPKRRTGFNPTAEFYRGAKYINVKADLPLINEFAAKGGLDYRKISYSPVRGQPNGSCWAEGAVSAFELNWNAVLRGKLVFAVNDVIDCSGFGSASRGGQLSLEYALGGLALESDYKYTGRDGKCRKDVERHNPLKEVALVRGEDGGALTEPELLTAFLKYGAMEICGSAGAMGEGGRQDKIRTGGTNHCYALGSAFPGASKGWLDKWYFGVKNSWGDGSDSALNISNGNWGDAGWGDYVISKDGSNISSDVFVEFMIGYAGDLLPPTPLVVDVKYGKVTLHITIQPSAIANKDVLLSKIEKAIAVVEAK